jgi:transposase-like protein
MDLENEKKRFVRYKEGARLYGVCQSTFEKWAKEAGATCKIGKAVLVDCETFEKYLESFRVPMR